MTRLFPLVLILCAPIAGIDHTMTKAAIKRAYGCRAIPADSKIYIDTNNGFDIFILAAFQAKGVRLKLTSKRDAADFIMDSSLFHDTGFIASGKTAGTYRISEAAFELKNKDGDIVWGCAASKGLFSRGGKQSVAEACAKHVKNCIERGTY